MKPVISYKTERDLIRIRKKLESLTDELLRLFSDEARLSQPFYAPRADDAIANVAECLEEATTRIDEILDEEMPDMEDYLYEDAAEERRMERIYNTL